MAHRIDLISDEPFCSFWWFYINMKECYFSGLQVHHITSSTHVQLHENILSYKIILDLVYT